MGLSAIPDPPLQVTEKNVRTSPHCFRHQLLLLPVPLPSLQQPDLAPRTQFAVRSTFPHPVEEGPGPASNLRGSANWNVPQPICNEVETLVDRELLKIDS